MLAQRATLPDTRRNQNGTGNPTHANTTNAHANATNAHANTTKAHAHTPQPGDELLQSEPCTVLNRSVQSISKLIFTAVRRQQQRVETCGCSGQTVAVNVVALNLHLQATQATDRRLQ